MDLSNDKVGYLIEENNELFQSKEEKEVLENLDKGKYKDIGLKLFSLSDKRKTTFKTKIQQLLKDSKILVSQLMKDDIKTVDLDIDVVIEGDQTTVE